MATRDERLARNQAIFRAANEALRRSAGDRAGLLTCICECGAESCRDEIRVSYDQYEAVRSADSRFMVVPGHESEGETVVQELDGLTIVEKVGRQRDIVQGGEARASD